MTQPQRTNPTDLNGCLALAQRQVGDTSGWTPDEWQAQLVEDALQRGDLPATYYRPYRSALAYISRPTVTNRAEGDTSEAYSVSLLQDLATRLRDLDVEWTAARIPPKSASTDEWDGKTEWTPW